MKSNLAEQLSQVPPHAPSHVSPHVPPPSALPGPMPDDEVIAEHDGDRMLQEHTTATARVLAEANDTASSVRPLHEVMAALRNSDRCPDCKKTRTVLNIAARHSSYRAERVTPETHCACIGGPAYAGIGGGLR
jgi:hypothetical protein